MMTAIGSVTMTSSRTVHVVYWTAELLSHSKKFTDLGEMLKFTEELRRAPENSFIATASEIEGSIGKAGVEGPPPGYDWRKRRK